MRSYRSWEDVQKLYNHQITQMKATCEELSKSGESRLWQRLMLKLLNVNWHVSMFWRRCLGTNLGAESEFEKLDIRITVSGDPPVFSTTPLFQPIII